MFVYSDLKHSPFIRLNTSIYVCTLHKNFNFDFRVPAAFAGASHVGLHVLMVPATRRSGRAIIRVIFAVARGSVPLSRDALAEIPIACPEA